MPAIKSDNIIATSFLRWQFYTEHSKTDISRGVIREVNRKLSVKALVLILNPVEEDFPCPISEVEERTGGGGAWAANARGERRGREESTIDGKGQRGPGHNTRTHERREDRSDWEVGVGWPVAVYISTLDVRDERKPATRSLAWVGWIRLFSMRGWESVDMQKYASMGIGLHHQIFGATKFKAQRRKETTPALL